MKYLNILFLLLFLLNGLSFGQTQITIFLAGDSTMANKPSVRRPETGWGEALQKYFDENKVLVINRAQNGKSTRTFVEQGFWQIILNSLKKDDYVFIQFGHNDESKNSPDRYVAPDDFRKNLTTFINQVREKKANPILLTPVMRRLFDKDGKFYDTHGEYPDIVRAVAKEQNVPLIDLHREMETIIKQYGAEDSKKLFLQLKAGENPNFPNGVEDNTHFSTFGADLAAKSVVESIRRQNINLAKYLKKMPEEKAVNPK